MAPLSLFRLKRQQPRRVVEPLSPDSFFSPGRSRSPSIIDTVADIILEAEPMPTPEPEPEPELELEAEPELQERLEPSATDDEERERERPSVPVSASASASAISLEHSIAQGPPTLALSLRFSFDAEGSLGDSIQRYFLSSHPDICRAGPTAPEPTESKEPIATVPAVRADRGTSTTTTTGKPQLQLRVTNNNDDDNDNDMNSNSIPRVSIHRPFA
jgi:hypothetical protein